MAFRSVTLAAGVVCSALFVALLVMPGFLMGTFGIDSDADGAFVARRTALLFLGYAALAFSVARTSHVPTQKAVSLAFLLSMGTLAIAGLAEFARGYAGPGIFLAIVTETVFALLYLRLWISLRQ